MLSAAAVAEGAMNATILRVHNLYGPRMDFSRSRSTFVARVVAAVRSTSYSSSRVAR